MVESGIGRSVLVVPIVSPTSFFSPFLNFPVLYLSSTHNSTLDDFKIQ
jgi:hypothetical protein